MATVINNPNAGQTDNTSWAGTLTVVLVVGALLALFFFYALPMMRGSNNNTATPNNDNAGAIEVKVPDKINIDTP